MHIQNLVPGASGNRKENEYASSSFQRPAETPFTGISPFLSKTYNLVQDPTTDEVISWTEGGRSFTVWQPEILERDVLPKHFKHNHISSFIRQLNNYGFRKVNPDRYEFASPGFIRGRQDLLASLQRSDANRKKSKREQGLVVAEDAERGVGGMSGEGVGGGGGINPTSSSSSREDHLRGMVEVLQMDKQFLRSEVEALRKENKKRSNEMRGVMERLDRSEQLHSLFFHFLQQSVPQWQTHLSHLQQQFPTQLQSLLTATPGSHKRPCHTPQLLLTENHHDPSTAFPGGTSAGVGGGASGVGGGSGGGAGGMGDFSSHHLHHSQHNLGAGGGGGVSTATGVGSPGVECPLSLDPNGPPTCALPPMMTKGRSPRLSIRRVHEEDASASSSGDSNVGETSIVGETSSVDPAASLDTLGSDFLLASDLLSPSTSIPVSHVSPTSQQATHPVSPKAGMKRTLSNSAKGVQGVVGEAATSKPSTRPIKATRPKLTSSKATSKATASNPAPFTKLSPGPVNAHVSTNSTQNMDSHNHSVKESGKGGAETLAGISPLLINPEEVGCYRAESTGTAQDWKPPTAELEEMHLVPDPLSLNHEESPKIENLDDMEALGITPSLELDVIGDLLFDI